MLPQLLESASYTPCDWDLLRDAEGRSLWLDLFDRQIDFIGACALESGYAKSRIDEARRRFCAIVRDLRADPRALGDSLDILVLDRARDGLLRECGIDDAFRAIKDRETQRALEALAERLDVLDVVAEESRLEEVIRGVFAGNLFDMGAEKTASMFLDGVGPAYEACLARAPSRPWGMDQLDGATLDGWRHAVLFVDNAGADAVLGMLPLARELLCRGSRVTLAANELPSLNDITAVELARAVERVPELRGAEVMSTGSGDPLIDLSDLDAGFCTTAGDADLVVLEGMGRGLESNWTARLSCETWRVAIVKAEPVSRKRGVALFDGVFRRDAPGA